MKTYIKGDFFGEIALLLGEPRKVGKHLDKGGIFTVKKIGGESTGRLGYL